MSGDSKCFTVLHGSMLCLFNKTDVSFPPLNIITPYVSSPSAKIIQDAQVETSLSFFSQQKAKGRRGKRVLVMDLAGLTQIQAASRRSGQPEVFRFYSGRDLGIRKAGRN